MAFPQFATQTETETAAFGYRNLWLSRHAPFPGRRATVSHTKSSGRIFVPDLINGCSAFFGEPETRNFHAGLIPSRRASRMDAAPVAPTAAVLTNSCYPERHALVRNFSGHRQGPENSSCFRSVASSRQPIVTARSCRSARSPCAKAFARAGTTNAIPTKRRSERWSQLPG